VSGAWVTQAAVTADLIDRLPIAGGAVVLIAIIGVVVRLWLGSEERHRLELDRISKAHVAEVRALNQRIDGLRQEVEQLGDLLNQERRARWAAQDVAAERRRRGGGHERDERRA